MQEGATHCRRLLRLRGARLLSVRGSRAPGLPASREGLWACIRESGEQAAPALPRPGSGGDGAAAGR